MFDSKSPFEGIRAPNFSSLMTMCLCIVLEGAMFTMFFAVYTETIGLMSDSYLSELPIIGSVIFGAMDSYANASHIISMLLAIFSVATPLFIWLEIFRQRILDDPQEWFSHKQNQILASIAAVILAMVIGLEVVNLYR